MKKLFIGLLMLGSMSSFANEYEKVEISCYFSGNVSTISSSQKERLPNRIISVTRVTSIKTSGKILKIEHDGGEIINIPSVKKKPGHWGIFVARRGYNLSFDRMSLQDSKKLLEELGATEVPTLKKGFSFGKIKINYAATIKTIQTHFPQNEYDGLSYHVEISCITRESK
jgi:hypothetical protein